MTDQRQFARQPGMAGAASTTEEHDAVAANDHSGFAAAGHGVAGATGSGASGMPRSGGAGAPDRLSRGIGFSDVPDAELAGRSAAEQALAALRGEPPALLLVYASVCYELPTLLAGVRAVAGVTPLAGATSSGMLYNGTAIEAGRGVAVLALTAGPYHFGVGSVSGLQTDSFAAGQAIARAARAAAGGEPQPYGAVIILADGFAEHHEALLAGVHKVIGAAVPVVGGAAADDRRLTETFVFAGDHVIADGAVAVWVGSPWPLTVRAAHGWQPIGLPMLVTKVDGTVVHEIGGRPAGEVFQECFSEQHPTGPDGSSCDCPCCRFAAAQRPATARCGRAGYHSSHALGLIQPDGSQLIRGAYPEDDGSLRTFCPLPTYSAVQLMTSRPDELLAVADTLVPSVLAARKASVVLVFSCVARWDLLAEQGPEEAARLQAAAGDVDTFGFYTYGEFARTFSVSGYHNATLAAIAL